jgi:L-seryl-tRNA(Ser) seleniumtransferase
LPSPRLIPAIEQLRREPEMIALEARYGHEAVIDALRAEAAALRGRFSSVRREEELGGPPLPASEAEAAREVVSGAAVRLAAAFGSSLRRVINATGVIVHTNLGRAPLSAAAVRRISELATGYTTLEYDLVTGTRGRRDIHAETLLTQLTGADAAVVVNNNAAATMLMLSALARGREVIISRGELVEIGGGFRVPDVMAQSGALLREVGTTNRTRVADYAAAIGPRTGLILRVHPSNFRIEGFTERPALADLAALAHRHDLPLAEDLGSGYLGIAAAAGTALGDEPLVRLSVAAVDIVCFSGDKLLGGPQAGILVGRKDLIATVRRHPLMRALRVDKLTYAALEATLLSWLAGTATRDVPVARMMSATFDDIAARAERLVAALRGTSGLRVSLLDGASTPGGGSAPGVQLPTRLVAVEKAGLSANEIEARLRRATTPIIARIQDDRVVLDLRTVDEADEREIVRVVAGL